jgi:F0F1-type ATP synthase membrane subunit c/vacuolar-type H+-ATPase subunit K
MVALVAPCRLAQVALVGLAGPQTMATQRHTLAGRAITAGLVVAGLVDTVALVGLVATTRAAVPRHQGRQEPQEQVALVVAVEVVLVCITRTPALKCMALVEGALAAGLALMAPALAGQARLERHTT